jgi:catechol 2,3-dioxygenase-like lactoylglutathione lyase family enzyme
MTYKVTGLRTWNMNAADLEAAVAFYRDVLGAEERGRHEARPGSVARLKLGTSGIGLFDAKDGPRPGVPHHTFDFEGPRDPQEMIRELEAKGARVEDLRMHGDGPGYSVYVTDPCGNRLELSTDPA